MALDRRVKYTRMALKESLLALLQDRPISRITIKAICEGADINRATYYAHYADQYDQLNQIELDFIDGINTFLDSLSTAADALAVIERIIDYVYENQALCRTLLSPNGDIGFEAKVEQLVRDRVCAAWHIAPPDPGTFLDFTYTYIVNGGVGVIKKWICGEQARQSPREMAEYINGLCYKGLQELIREGMQG